MLHKCDDLYRLASFYILMASSMVNSMQISPCKFHTTLMVCMHLFSMWLVFAGDSLGLHCVVTPQMKLGNAETLLFHLVYCDC